VEVYIQDPKNRSVIYHVESGAKHLKTYQIKSIYIFTNLHKSLRYCNGINKQKNKTKQKR